MQAVLYYCDRYPSCVSLNTTHIKESQLHVGLDPILFWRRSGNTNIYQSIKIYALRLVNDNGNARVHDLYCNKFPDSTEWYSLPLRNGHPRNKNEKPQPKKLRKGK